MYSVTPPHKSKSDYIFTAATGIAGTALLFLGMGGHIAYPVIAQMLGLIFYVVCIYALNFFISGLVSYSIEATGIIGEDGREKYDLVIRRANKRKSVTLCRIGTDEIDTVIRVNTENKATVKAARKQKRKYVYTSELFPTDTFCIMYDGEDFIIILSYDKKLYDILEAESKR